MSYVSHTPEGCLVVKMKTLIGPLMINRGFLIELISILGMVGKYC